MDDNTAFSPFQQFCAQDVAVSDAKAQRKHNTSSASAVSKPMETKLGGGRTAESCSFLFLCRVCESLLGAVNKHQQQNVLNTFWRSLSTQESFFPFMRLLLPYLDTVRPMFNLKESKLARLYVDILGLAPQGADAQRLLHWKDPSRSTLETTSFSDVIYVLLQSKGGFQQLRQEGERGEDTINDKAGETNAKRCFSGLSVAEMNNALDELAAAESTEARRSILLNVLRRTTPVEQRWLLRIILKDMKFRMSHQTMLSAFHPTALDTYNSTSDLKYVCDMCHELIQNPGPGPGSAGLFLFQPIRPMLASPVTTKKLEQVLEAERVYAEPKYDGERMMLHISGEKIMYWTRNAKNYTPLYAPKFDPTVRSCVPLGIAAGGSNADGESEGGGGGGGPLRIENVILDGEFLVYNGTTNSFVEFGMNRTFANSGGGESGSSGSAVDQIDGQKNWFCYMVFDIVFLNGESVMDLPLSTRRTLLKRVVSEQAKHLEIVQSKRVRTTREILAELERAVEGKNEGIVLKVGGSPYVPAERKTKWLKIKCDHIVGLVDTMDFVIVGGFYGTKFGARSLTHFLLATWDRRVYPDVTDPKTRFMTVVKVGNGYNSGELRAIQASLQAHWETMPNRQTIPPWLDGWKPVASDLTPDVYVHPRHSVVLEVLGYSFSDSVNYKVGYTIRFPRVLRVRWDKELGDITDLATLETIKAASRDALQTKGTGGGAANDELLTVLALKRKRREGNEQAAAAAAAIGGKGSTPSGGAAAMREASTLPPRATAVAPDTLGVATLQKGEAPEDMLFDGYELCVLFTSRETCPGNPEVLGNKTQLERCLLLHGGKVVANPRSTTSLIVASTASAAKVQNWCALYRAKPQYVLERYPHPDIVSCAWIEACLHRGAVLPLAPRFMLFTSAPLQRKFAMLLDKFEDNYYQASDDLDGMGHSLQLARQHMLRRRREELRDGNGGEEGAPRDAWDALSRRVHSMQAELGILRRDGNERHQRFLSIAACTLHVPANSHSGVASLHPDGEYPTETQLALTRVATEIRERMAYDPESDDEGATETGKGDEGLASATKKRRLEPPLAHPADASAEPRTPAAATTKALPDGIDVVTIDRDQWSVQQLIAITRKVLDDSCYASPTCEDAELLVDQYGRIWKR